MKFKCIVLLNAFLLFFYSGVSAVEVVLKSGDLNAESGKIYLEDIADILNAPRDAEKKLRRIYVKRAAYPGKKVSVTRARVINLVRRHYGDIKVSGPGKIYVKTRKKTVLGEDAAETALRFLEKKMPYKKEDVKIKVKSVRERINVPDGEVLLKPRQDSDARLKGSVIVPVEIFVDGKLYSTVPVSLMAKVKTDCLAASVDIPRRTMVDDSMFGKKRMDITYLPDDVISDPAVLETRITKRGIPAGTVLLRSMFESIPLFERKQRVRVIAKRGDLEVETFGEALREGREGDRVKVRLLTGKTVEGSVNEEGKVIIQY
ncbi:MAG: flagellar basal body P-ring formation chaperone FlgA [Candidatus Goldiibacteriota bacterium]